MRPLRRFSRLSTEGATNARRIRCRHKLVHTRNERLNKVLGDQGEAFAARLLRARGYKVREIGGNYPVIDLEVSGSEDFRVSVKTSRSKRHVRLGSESSVSQLLDTDFVFAFMPKAADHELELEDGQYDLWIVPGAIARKDALWVHRTYLEESSAAGKARSGTAGILVKSYSRRPPQREVWGRWECYLEKWSGLPPALTPRD